MKVVAYISEMMTFSSKVMVRPRQSPLQPLLIGPPVASKSLCTHYGSFCSRISDSSSWCRSHGRTGGLPWRSSIGAREEIPPMERGTPTRRSCISINIRQVRRNFLLCNKTFLTVNAGSVFLYAGGYSRWFMIRMRLLLLIISCL